MNNLKLKSSTKSKVKEEWLEERKKFRRNLTLANQNQEINLLAEKNKSLTLIIA